MKIKVLLVCGFLGYFTNSLYGQELRWFKEATFLNNGVSDVRDSYIGGKPYIDDKGNVYFKFQHISPAIVSGVKCDSNGLTNVVIQKYDSSGKFLGQISIGLQPIKNAYYSPRIHVTKEGQLLLYGSYAFSNPFVINGKQYAKDTLWGGSLFSFDSSLHFMWNSYVPSDALTGFSTDSTILMMTTNKLAEIRLKDGSQKRYKFFSSGYHMKEVVANKSAVYVFMDFSTFGNFANGNYDSILLDHTQPPQVLHIDSSKNLNDLVLVKLDYDWKQQWMRPIEMPRSQVKNQTRQVSHFDKNGNLHTFGLWRDTLEVNGKTYYGSKSDYQLFYLSIDTEANVIWSNANTSATNMAKLEDIKESEYDPVTETWNIIGFSNKLDFGLLTNITSPDAPFYRLRLTNNGSAVGISNYLSQYHITNYAGVCLKGRKTAIELARGLEFRGNFYDKSQAIFAFYDDSTGSNVGIHYQPQTSFSIFPNPVSSLLHISSSEPQHMLLRDIQGRLVWQGSLSVGTAQVNVADLPQGLYVLSSTQKSGSIRFIKQ